jgi:TetR/AcrR family acrAB operon transcriptional repressor
LHSLLDGLIQNWILEPAAFDLRHAGEHAVDTQLMGLRRVQAARDVTCK